MKNHPLTRDLMIDLVPGTLIMVICNMLLFLPPEFWMMGLFLDIFGTIYFAYQLDEVAKRKKQVRQGHLEDHSEKMIGDKKPVHEVIGRYKIKEHQR